MNDDRDMRPKHQQSTITVAAGISVLGALCSVVGAAKARTPDLLVLFGVTFVVVGVIGIVGALLWRLFCDRIRPLDRMFLEGLDAGRNEGYHEGYRDGRRAARPVVVPVRCPHCGQDFTGKDKRTG